MTKHILECRCSSYGTPSDETAGRKKKSPVQRTPVYVDVDNFAAVPRPTATWKGILARQSRCSENCDSELRAR